MKATSGRCVLCAKYLRVSTGRHSEGRVLYSRIGRQLVPVGVACTTHFTGDDPFKPISLEPAERRSA